MISASRRRANRGARVPDVSSAFELAYAGPEAFEALRTSGAGRVLGAIAFGAEAPAVAERDFPFVWVDMPVLGAGPMFEVWLSAQPVVREDVKGVVAARNDEVLFGAVQVEDRGSLDEKTYLAYERIFDFLDDRGYPHLLRVWNYFARINSPADGLERYQRFCRGRHDAFAAKGRIIGQDTPAASALGSRDGPLTIYFLAAKTPGERVENPRQMSAYHYPAQYGPRSPTFSRAMRVQGRLGTLLFISGTAGIVGHETQHPGNATEQAQETMVNLRAVIAQARIDAAGGRLAFKAYLRHPDYLPVVRDCLSTAFGAQADVLYLQADICRADLLLEVEAVYVDQRGAHG